VTQQLDLSALDGFVGGAGRARAHHALDLDAKLVAQALGDSKHLGPVGVADHLQRAFAVAQVDEDHAAVVAPAVDPAAQADGLAQQGFGDQTAIVAAHRHVKAFKNR